MITQQQKVKTAIPDLRDLPLDMLAELGGRLSRTLLLFTGNDSKRMADRSVPLMRGYRDQAG